MDHTVDFTQRERSPLVAMFSRVIKIAAASTMVGASGIGSAAAVVASDTDDNLSPASTTVTANLKSGTTLTGAGTINGVSITVVCTKATFSGKTPAKGLTETLPNPPAISGCSIKGVP